MKKKSFLRTLTNAPIKMIRALFKFGYVTPLNSRQVMLLNERKFDDNNDKENRAD